MQTRLETLRQHLAIVEKFETLFNTTEVAAFEHKYRDENNDDNFIKNIKEKPFVAAFDQFKFSETDARTEHLAKAIALLKQIFGSNSKVSAELAELDKDSSKRVKALFNLTIRAILNNTQPNLKAAFLTLTKTVMDTTLGSPTASDAANEPLPNKTRLDELRSHVQQLIGFQKKSIEASIKETIPLVAAETEQKGVMARRNKMVRYAGAGTALMLGAGLTTVSALMQFNPHFALLAGMHLPVAALAAVTVAGVAIAGLAAYVAYRTYRPAAVIPTETATSDAPALTNPLYAKLVTAALMTSGFGMGAFAAMVQFNVDLIQFSPKFALLAGLHLSPIALIAIAAVGALLVSAGLYRMIKAYRTSTPDDALPAAPSPAVEPTTYYQRMASLFKFCSPKQEQPDAEHLKPNTLI